MAGLTPGVWHLGASWHPESIWTGMHPMGGQDYQGFAAWGGQPLLNLRNRSTSKKKGAQGERQSFVFK